MKLKPWYRSRTLWANVIGIVVLIAQEQFGYVINLESQAFLLALINMILRLDTETSIAL